MRKLAMLLPAVALIAAACGEPDVIVQPGAGEDGVGTGISVSGRGRVEGAPDTISVSLAISVLRDSVGDAVADAAVLADRLIETIKDEGVEAADIQTTDYSVYPERDHFGEKSELRGFRVTNRVSVAIRDLARAGDVIDAATAVAGDEVLVSGLSFSLEDNQALLDAARAAAWSDAEEKARQLAALAGVELGPPTSIQETFGSMPPPPIVFAEDFGRAATTPIEPGELSVSVLINVTFGIAP